jgi:hypothetical protein
MMTLERSMGLALVVGASVFVLAGSAAGKGGQGETAALAIDAVQFADLQGNQKNIEILGGGFGNGAFPVVSLDGEIELEVLEASDSEISAKIPAHVLDGDYSLVVSTGSAGKQNDAMPIHLGGTLSVICLDWYLTTGPDHHIHVEGYVQDENGDPVIGAALTLENTVDGEIYQVYNTTTFKYAGYNHGESCPIEVAKASGASGQACCIGGATDPPDDSRSCAPGVYEALVLSLQPPAGSDRKWDGITPPNGRQFDGP